MNNIGANISIGATATLGIFGMENRQFEPTTLFFYFVGIAIISFVMGFFGEQVQLFLQKIWGRLLNKIKSIKDEMGMGNRYV